jgi:hypothetical protein
VCFRQDYLRRADVFNGKWRRVARINTPSDAPKKQHGRLTQDQLPVQSDALLGSSYAI